MILVYGRVYLCGAGAVKGRNGEVIPHEASVMMTNPWRLIH